MGKKISVIIPGYNEEEIIRDSILRVEKELSYLNRPYEILIVNDGSTDKTGIILKEFMDCGKHPYISVISYDDGPSRRENLIKSFKLLQGDHIILLDMDLAMSLQHIKEMVYWLEEGYDLVLANRYHKKSVLSRKLNRLAISKIYNLIIRTLFRTGIKDNICGFKAFKSEAINRLVAESGIDHSRTRSVFWDTEIVIHALRNKMKIKQIPVEWKEGKKSSLNIKRESSMIPYIIKFWLKSFKK